MANKKKQKSGITWTQMWLILAIVFGIYQVQQKQQVIQRNIQMEQKMERCVCSWEDVFDKIETVQKMMED